MRMRLGLFLIPVILLSGCSYVPRIPGVTPGIRGTKPQAPTSASNSADQNGKSRQTMRI